MKRRQKILAFAIIVIVLLTGCTITNAEGNIFSALKVMPTMSRGNLMVATLTVEPTDFTTSCTTQTWETSNIETDENVDSFEFNKIVISTLKLLQQHLNSKKSIEEIEILEDIDTLEEEKISEIETKVQPLPKSILDEIKYQRKKYPGISIAVGIYSLDAKKGYEYNENAIISGGCTIKAPYALYVLQECERQNIDITTETLTYKKGMRNNGSGIIKNSKYGTKYTIAYLLDKLLGISDNTAYNILVSKFPLNKYQEFLNEIDGQQLNGLQYGAASVLQRKNEWLTIYRYLNSNAKYADTLRGYITNTKYCYITSWMSGDHTYMHKSGWSYGSYSCAADCAIIDENYLLIVLTQDYVTGESHADVVKSIGVRVEEYANSLGGYIF